MGEWRTIDSAPRDGTRVLTYTPASAYKIQTEDVICAARWRKEWSEGEPEWVATFGPIRPTHWMPLLPPPKEQ